MTTDLILVGAFGALAFGFVKAVRCHSPRGALFSGVGAAGAGWWAWSHISGVTLFLLGVVALASLAVAAVYVTRTESTVTRWGNRSRRNSGVATTLDIVRVGSAWAMRRKTTSVRPSTRDMTRWERWKLPIAEVAVALGRVGMLWLYASIEDVVVIFGGPRRGKTGQLAGIIIDAPGAVVSTSTRLDLMELTSTLRQQLGPVWVFNPGDLGGVPSTLGFNPLAGCEDPVTATERAADMIPESEDGERAAWEAQARRVMTSLMHAAALGGLTMTDVQRWVADPDAAENRIMSLIRRSSEPAFVHDVKHFIKTTERTRSSITHSMQPALRWVTNSAAVAATQGGDQFDVAELLRSRGTVYLLGRHEAHTAPLLAALTGYIAREARRIAAYQPGGRLDPPLLLALDEAARVAPVPLPDWSGDAGGSGICLVCCFQSRADLVDRWGAAGASKVINNAGSVLLWGGTKDPDDLEAWAKLAGDRDEVVVTTGKDGKVTSRSVRKVPVLSTAQLANLPKWRAVVFRGGMPPAISTPRMAWDRRDVKADIKSRAATPAPGAAAPVPTRIPQTVFVPPGPRPREDAPVVNGSHR